MGINVGPNMIELHDYLDKGSLSLNANFIEYFFGTELELEDGTSMAVTKIGMNGGHSFYVRESYYTVKNLIDNLKG